MNPKKKQILHVAYELFIEKGFASTSIQDILNKAKIAKGTFYNHFISKNDCLMAIMDRVREEAFERRRELAIGQKKDDPDVFIKQIAVRMRMNHERNLVTLYESVFHTKDTDLKEYMRKQHIFELNWMANRIVDLFGERARRYAIDQAAMIFGMIHHLMHVWTFGTEDEPNTEVVIKFAIARATVSIRDQIASDDAFFPIDWLRDFNKENAFSNHRLIEQLIIQTKALLTILDKEATAKQISMLSFLIDEAQSENPRNFLLESVLESLSCELAHSQHQSEVIHMIQIVAKLN